MSVAVVTGAASGIGRATRQRLEAGGWRVIGVDLHDSDVVADLATEEGRARMVESVGSPSRSSKHAKEACVSARN